ncbi:25575_t:CDS:2, partial [Racocetra persica]
GNRPDYQIARKWKSNHDSASTIGPSFHLNATFTGNPLISGNISGGSFDFSKSTLEINEVNKEEDLEINEVNKEEDLDSKINKFFQSPNEQQPNR